MSSLFSGKFPFDLRAALHFNRLNRKILQIESVPGTPVLLTALKKPTFPNSNSIWNVKAKGLSAVVTNC